MRPFIVSAATALLLIFGHTALAAAPAFKAGDQYKLVSPPQPTNEPGKVRVTEIFWYHCPHCFHFDPMLRKWVAKQPKYVDFRRVPAAFGKLWTLDAKVYYAMKSLDVLDRMHSVVFNAIHKKHRRLESEDAYAKFFAEHGVDADKFRAAFESFGVQTRVKRAGEYVQSLHVVSVPTIIIDGKYMTNAEQAGSYKKLLKVMSYLVAKEHKSGK
jgi:thiol:disulfide interchange protein DsbA